MKINTKYQGDKNPFIGDTTLWLRSLPVDAKVTTATVRLTPANAPDFLETFTFPKDNLKEGELLAEDWGVTKTSSGNFIEVDFHSRRTLAAVAGTGGEATLQIDMGGAYVAVASDGTISPNKGDFSVNLSQENTVKLPGLIVNKVKLTRAEGNLDVTKVSIRSVPTNVSVRLEQLSPFWTHLGELATDSTSPDFAAVLNSFLTTAEVQDGFYQIPFVIHSDAIARLNIALEINFIIEQRVLPPHLPEVKLAYNFSTLPSVDEAVTTVTLPRSAIALSGKSTALVAGEFQPSRVAFGSVGEDPTNIPSQNPDINVVVSPQCLLAQPITPAQEIAVTGIDLPLGNTQAGLAGLHLAIQSDADGKPSGEVLASAEVVVDKPLPNQSTWGSARLPEPFRIEHEPDKPAKRYWLVLQSQQGEAFWNATHDTTKNTTGNPGLQCSQDGGFSWRVATMEKAPSPLRALFRLRTIPEKFTVPVQLQIGKGAEAKRQRLDEFAPLGRIEFRFDFAQTLSQYLQQPSVAAPCGRGKDPVLKDGDFINGDFTELPPDDCTRRLFGIDAARAVEGYPNNQAIITGTVDLSRGVNLSKERFIMLAVNDKKPPVRIDCAGKEPARTQLDEIIQAINKAMGGITVASKIEGDLRSAQQRSYRLQIASPSTNNYPTSTSTPRSIELFTWCNTQIPKGWQGTLGQIFRLLVPQPDEPGRVVLLLAHPSLLNQGIVIDGEIINIASFPVVSAARASTTGAANISQRFAVVDGCTYLFQFSFQISKAQTYNDTLSPGGDESLSPPRWELVWLDSTGAVLRLDSEAIEFSTRSQSEEPTPWFYESLLKTPANAANAEVRFVHPFPKEYALVVEQVSFTPTVATLRNGSFQQWQGYSSARLPVAWTAISGWVDEERDREQAQVIAIRLRGDAPEETILVQTTEVTSLQRYELQIHSRTLSPSTAVGEALPVQQRSRVELHWQGTATMSAPIIIPLDGQDFATHTWVGNAPDGATSAEIHLIQPKGKGESPRSGDKGKGDLLVESVSLSRADVVSVPLILLSEAPGELTISDLRVAYDLPEPPKPRGRGLGSRGLGGGEDTETRRHGDTGKEFTTSPRPSLPASYPPSPLSRHSEASVISEPPNPVISIYPEEAASSSTPEPAEEEEKSEISEYFTDYLSNYSEEIPNVSTPKPTEEQEESLISEGYTYSLRNYTEETAHVREDTHVPNPNSSNIDQPSEKLPPPISRRRRKTSPGRAIIRLLKITFKKLRRFLSSLARRLFSFAKSGNKQSPKIRKSQRSQQSNS